MLYYKPKDITYTYMAMWIDANAYREDRNEQENEQFFKYLYLLAHMFAFKAKLFSTAREYDEFSIYFATFMFERYANKKQDIIEDGLPKLKRIKSCTNYMRNVLVFVRNRYFDEIFKDIGLAQDKENPYSMDDPNYLFEMVMNQDELLKCESFLYLEDLPRSLKGTLKYLPIKENSSEFINLYASCLLTLINQFTMCREDMISISKLTSEQSVENTYRRQYKLNIPKNVILYNLPESMRNFVAIQCQKFILATRKELQHIDAYQIDTRAVMLDAYNEINNNTEIIGELRDEQA